MSFDRRKIRTGRVVSDKMEKTIVVQLESRYVHRIYRKAVKTRSNIKVHDPENSCKVGDLVKVMEVRPISKDKTWLLKEILLEASEETIG
ncbi:MAG: 30S ribosomal protein S17 [Chloroflexi bacterium]|nr:30S ribosomal protein S17 [Chloroflexota bacterium]|tara:strand:- start:798 stop:1067 length:270 start_codon:yes stop_codon:yes gene_type:complete